jgi:hypothetical protein
MIFYFVSILSFLKMVAIHRHTHGYLTGQLISVTMSDQQVLDEKVKPHHHNRNGKLISNFNNSTV